jgi:hypothetical protein
MDDPTHFSRETRRAASRLRASAAREIPGLSLLESALNEIMIAYRETRDSSPPHDAQSDWRRQAITVDLAGLMAVRCGQAIALLVRSGLSVEASGLVRRLGEVAQRAAGVADEQSGGDYARSWRASEGKPSKAYVRGVDDVLGARKKWAHLSNFDHADLGPFLEVLATPTETGGVGFPAAPARHLAFDASHTAGAALDLTRVALAIRAVYHADPSGPLEVYRRYKEHESTASAQVDELADAYAEARRRHESRLDESTE